MGIGTSPALGQKLGECVNKNFPGRNWGILANFSISKYF
jgi:hypothetical protein